jgi:hypothetical protein
MRLHQVPDLVEGLRLAATLLDDVAAEAHADDLLVGLVRDVQHLGVHALHIGVVVGGAALLQVEPHRRKELRRGEAAQVVQVGGVVGGAAPRSRRSPARRSAGSWRRPRRSRGSSPGLRGPGRRPDPPAGPSSSDARARRRPPRHRLLRAGPQATGAASARALRGARAGHPAPSGPACHAACPRTCRHPGAWPRHRTAAPWQSRRQSGNSGTRTSWTDILAANDRGRA